MFMENMDAVVVEYVTLLLLKVKSVAFGLDRQSMVAII